MMGALLTFISMELASHIQIPALSVPLSFAQNNLEKDMNAFLLLPVKGLNSRANYLALGSNHSKRGSNQNSKIFIPKKSCYLKDNK